MNRVLVLGANGQLGFELRRTLAPLGAVTCATRRGELVPGLACETADLSNAAALTTLLDRVQPTVIANAAAYTAVDRAEDEPDLARRVNADAPGVLGRWAAAHGALVLHYSTDYVFDGDATTAYRETDATAPLGVYGATKLVGERALVASGATHLIVRTAWVYAPRGHNFLLSMLRLARTRDNLRVVADQHGAPTPAALIAAASGVMLARWLAADVDTRAKLAGVYHLTSGGDTTWCDFAARIITRAHTLGLVPRATPVAPIPTADYPTRAKRPAWSVLDTSRVEQTFGLTLPDWQSGVDGVLADLAAARATQQEQA